MFVSTDYYTHRYCGEVCRMKGWDEHKEAVLYDVFIEIPHLKEKH